VKSEILYGIHPVQEALAANRRQVDTVYLDITRTSERLLQIESLAASRGIACKKIGPAEFTGLVGTAGHQGAAARVSPYPLSTVADILSRVQSRGGRHFLLILDNVQDPQNLGAIIRTAVCVGADGVILPKDRSAPPSAAVSRVSAGALEHIRLTRVTNLVRTLAILKKNGLWIIGLDNHAAQSIYGGDLTDSVAFVLGGEEKGIRPLVKKSCDFLLSIPQLEPVDSLNVSVAAAVAMYETFRQRQYLKAPNQS